MTFRDEQRARERREYVEDFVVGMLVWCAICTGIAFVVGKYGP